MKTYRFWAGLLLLIVAAALFAFMEPRAALPFAVVFGLIGGAIMASGRQEKPT